MDVRHVFDLTVLKLLLQKYGEKCLIQPPLSLLVKILFYCINVLFTIDSSSVKIDASLVENPREAYMVEPQYNKLEFRSVFGVRIRWEILHF